MFSFVDKALALSSCMASVVLGLVQKVSIFDVSAIAFSLFFRFWQPDEYRRFFLAASNKLSAVLFPFRLLPVVLLPNTNVNGSPLFQPHE